MKRSTKVSSTTRNAAQILFALFALGLFVSYFHFGATEVEVQYGLFLFLSTLIVMGLLLLPLPRLPTWPLLALLGTGFILLLQITLNGPVLADGYLFTWLGWSGLFLTLLLIQSGIPLGALVLLLISVGIFQAAYGLLQALGGHDYIGNYFRGEGRLATGTLINRNHFAALLNMTIPMSLGMLYAGFLKRRQTGNSLTELTARLWIALLGLGIMGLAVVLSLSRAGVATLILTQLFMASLLVAGRHRQQRRSGTLFAVAAGGLLVIVAGLATGAGISPLISRLEESRSGWARRSELYGNTLELIRDHPWTGVGPGMYRWRIRPYLTVQPADYHHAHNDYLESAAEWGLPVAIAFWALALACLRLSIVQSLRAGAPWSRGVALGCAGALFSILLHSLIDLNLRVPANWMLFTSILGISLAPCLREGPPAGMGPPRSPLERASSAPERQ